MIMELRCVWVMFIVFLAITIQQTVSVRVVVVRENADSSSVEDNSESLSAEESEEIDFLMDLIQNEALDRNPPPVTTVRVIKRKPEVEQVAQHSVRKEKVESKPPTSFKEYHVHYHNHQHKGPLKPFMAFQEDHMHPLIWGPQLPLGDFDFYRQLHKAPSAPFPERARVKSFRDFETFLRSNMKPPAVKLDPESQLEALKDFDTFVKPRIPTFKTKEASPFDRIRKFHEYFDSEEKVSFPHHDRFAAFKDFSELENADKSDEKASADVPEKKNVKIKDFAIVIKSKPRTSQNKDDINKHNNNKDESPGPKIPPFVNKLRIPNHHPFNDLPKVLEAAGGTPKYIDELNQLKYPQPDIFTFPFRNHFPLHLNELSLNEQRNMLHRRPVLPPHLPMHPVPRYPLRNLNGWLLKRLLR